jgi:hypothetical protein
VIFDLTFAAAIFAAVSSGDMDGMTSGLRE